MMIFYMFMGYICFVLRTSIKFKKQFTIPSTEMESLLILSMICSLKRYNYFVSNFLCESSISIKATYMVLYVLYVSYIYELKVGTSAKIRKRYNQVPHLTQHTTWESNKNTINITNKSQDVSLFPSGGHKAAMNGRESMTNTRQVRQMIHKRSTALEQSAKILNWRALTSFTAPTSPLILM